MKGRVSLSLRKMAAKSSWQLCMLKNIQEFGITSSKILSC